MSDTGLKLSLCLTKHYIMKVYLETEVQLIAFLTLTQECSGGKLQPAILPRKKRSQMPTG
jgi:hypothetical protein